MGLKFDRVSPWADLKTNVVVITIVLVETLIGVSPVVQPCISVTFPYTFGLVGVAPVCLPYTPVALPYTSVTLPYTFRKPPLDFCIPPLNYL